MATFHPIMIAGFGSWKPIGPEGHKHMPRLITLAELRAVSPRASLTGITERSTTKSATLLVGLNKGQKPINRKGKCPAKMTPEAAKRTFIAARKAQLRKLGLPAPVGASIQVQSGFYEGVSEKSVAIQVIHEGGDFQEFGRQMLRLADVVGKKMCQDSVLVVIDDGVRRETAKCEWDQPDAPGLGSARKKRKRR